jgi:predicted nucleotidyltransferase
MHSNIEKLEQAVKLLEELADDVVFIGGCVTGILITDPAAPTVRGTIDVDVIANVDKLSEYYKLQEALRAKGFTEDTSIGAPICRYKNRDVILDVMPIDPNVLNFGNNWFKPAFKSAEQVKLPSGKVVLLISAPYFLACKFSAFKGRGSDDYVMSHDLEDIITIIDGRLEIEDEIAKSETVLRLHLVNCFKTLLKDNSFHEALPGFLSGDEASQGRAPIILSKIESIAGFK